MISKETIALRNLIGYSCSTVIGSMHMTVQLYGHSQLYYGPSMYTLSMVKIQLYMAQNPTILILYTKIYFLFVYYIFNGMVSLLGNNFFAYFAKY